MTDALLSPQKGFTCWKLQKYILLQVPKVVSIGLMTKVRVRGKAKHGNDLVTHQKDTFGTSY